MRQQENEQLSLSFVPMNVNTNNMVVQGNDLVLGKQTLQLNEAKLIRLAIMQIVPEDEDFKPYVIGIKELAKVLGVSSSNLYRDIEDICTNISKKPIKIRKGKSWKSIPWVAISEYKDGTGNVYLLLNQQLKPYLLQLKEYYVQYCLQYTLSMRSTNSIRIFELIQEGIRSQMIPKDGIDVSILLETIVNACDCEGKYLDKNKKFHIGMFKKRVIDTAIAEIEHVSLYRVTYKTMGRPTNEFIFHVNMSYH